LEGRGGGLTFGQRVPAGPIGYPLVKVVSAVPALVHPAVGVRVGFGQLAFGIESDSGLGSSIRFALRFIVDVNPRLDL
jgi:hypothetical protein